MKKKILSSVLCLAMLSTMVTPVFAETTAAATTTVDTSTATSTADLKAEALVFDLEVPTSLPITVDNEGNVEVATDATITNNSGGMVKVTNVSLDTTDSGWTIVEYDTDFSKEKVGLTQFGIIINEDEVDTDGSMTLGSEWESLYANGGTLDIDYEVNVASQASALELSIATVEFTLDWDSVEVGEDTFDWSVHSEYFYVDNGTGNIFLVSNGGLPEILVYPKEVDGLTATTIASSLFANQSSLTTIYISENVNIINEGAFSGCSSLTTVYYEGTMEQWNTLKLSIGDANSYLNNATIICADGTING